MDCRVGSVYMRHQSVGGFANFHVDVPSHCNSNGGYLMACGLYLWRCVCAYGGVLVPVEVCLCKLISGSACGSGDI